MIFTDRKHMKLLFSELFKLVKLQLSYSNFKGELTGAEGVKKKMLNLLDVRHRISQS